MPERDAGNQKETAALSADKADPQPADQALKPRGRRADDTRRSVRVVALGGGTGLSTLLRGLKEYVVTAQHPVAAGEGKQISQLSAIVTVTDDGGSSGRLRKEFNILPPGDIRNCLVALAEDEATLSKLFRYRFTGGSGLEGHNFGNLFLTALTDVMGDFGEAVKESSAVLASRGQIFPSTMSNVQLDAWMADGTRVLGETNITASKAQIREVRMIPANAKPLPAALEAIARADLITVGPGSLYTSLVPNMLVRGIPEAVAESKAVKVFVCNLMTQANESLGMTAADHIRALRKHAGRKVFDYALVNTAPVSGALLARYKAEGAEQIVADVEEIEAMGVRCVTGDFAAEGDVVRHATERVAEKLMELA